jgi:uncharacterized protein involved in exopolysaccharide biosynthesis
MPDAAQNPTPQPPSAPEDEVNLLELVYVLVKYKLVIALCTVAGLAAGYLVARAVGPSYYANATVMAKETDKQAANFGALGALGGLAAAQLSLAGNPGLEKIEVHLDSRRFKAELIERYELLDDIYKYGAPRIYKKHYDTLKGAWAESKTFLKPEPLKSAEFFSQKFFKREIDAKRGILTISVKSRDSLFTSKVLEGCLEHLNKYIQTSVQKDAKDNVDFLEKQLITIADPLLREKLQGMIATEIEKAMIISKEAFKVIDRPLCVKRHKERLMYPIAAAAGMFMASCAAAMFLYYAFGMGNASGEGKKWAVLIRREIFRII